MAEEAKTAAASPAASEGKLKHAPHWDPHSEAHARRRRTPKHPAPGFKGPRVMKKG